MGSSLPKNVFTFYISISILINYNVLNFLCSLHCLIHFLPEIFLWLSSHPNFGAYAFIILNTLSSNMTLTTITLLFIQITSTIFSFFLHGISLLHYSYLVLVFFEVIILYPSIIFLVFSPFHFLSF